MSLPDAPPTPNVPLASWAQRINDARFILIAAGLVLGCCVVAWDVPVTFAAGAFAVLLLVAAFVPRRTAAERELTGAAAVSAIWPANEARAALDALPRAALMLDTGATVRHANERARAIFPATREGDPFTFTFRAPEIGDALRQAQAGRASLADYREPGAAGGAYSVSFNPLAAPSGSGADTVGDGANRPVLVVFDDVSERLALDRMRADFVANASHELRTPLASLTGFIETLLGPARHDPVASERFLNIMLDQARRMRRLIDDLLSLSRVEMRVHRRPTDPVELGPILLNVRDALGPLARDHKVDLQVDIPAGSVRVAGDRDELVQVFQNLIENAIRYGASGGRVEVGLQNGEGMAAVHVQDYGPGIPAEHLPRLTERFYRVDVGASREMKGTGLGLAIVKHILVRHLGQLEVKSRPGEGARFTVLLPQVARGLVAVPESIGK